MPYFFAHIDRCKGQQDAEKKDYKKHDTSMDYLQTRIGSFRARPLPYGYEDLPFETVLDRGDLDERKVNRRQITRIIAKTREYLLDVWQIQAHVPPSEERNVLVQHEQDDYVASILKERINRHTMQRLLRVVDNPRLIRERHFILRVLLQTKKSDLLNGLIETKTIVECVRIGRSFDEYEIPEGQKTVKDMTYKMPTEALTKSALKRHLRKPQNRRSSKSILPIIKVSAK